MITKDNTDELLDALLVTEEDIELIWDSYHQIYGFYPIGKKSCSNCIRQSLIQLNKYLTIQLLKNG